MKKSDAIKELERMANERKRLEFPDFPVYAMPLTRYTDTSTNDLQTCIVDYLDFIGGWGVRVNTQGQYVEKLGRFIPGQTKRGTPDCLGCLPNGIFIGIECKQNERDKLSEDQEKIRKHIIQAGGRHIIAHVGKFQEVYEQINNILKQHLIN